MICKVLEAMAGIGYYVVSGLDITRKDNDKSLLLFRSGAPTQATFMCISLNDTDKVKLINAPPDVVQVYFVVILTVLVKEKHLAILFRFKILSEWDSCISSYIFYFLSYIFISFLLPTSLIGNSKGFHPLGIRL